MNRQLQSIDEGWIKTFAGHRRVRGRQATARSPPDQTCFTSSTFTADRAGYVCEIGETARLTIAEDPVPTIVAELLLETGKGQPDDTITATGPDFPSFIPVKLSSFTRRRPEPHHFAVPHRR